MSRDRKVKSFEGFVGNLREQSPELIVVCADLKPPQRLFGLLPLPSSHTVGVLGEWRFGLRYMVETERRTRTYGEHLLTAYQSERGIADQATRERRAISTLLAAEARVDLLKPELPDTDIYVGNPSGQLMSAEESLKLHGDAQELGVVSLLDYIQQAENPS